MLLSKLEKRIIEISYKNKLSHLSSCLTTLPILLDIYENKKIDEKLVLSSGHAGLALYVVLEHYYQIDAEQLLNDFGIHPYKDISRYCYVSSGSLGLGILIATGMALANKNKNIYCIISDGECAEGSVWEALRFANEKKLNNLKIYVNINGFSAYDKIDKSYLINRLTIFLPEINIYITNSYRFDFLKGLDAHYHIITEPEFNSIKF
jgi:transketolase